MTLSCNTIDEKTLDNTLAINRSLIKDYFETYKKLKNLERAVEDIKKIGLLNIEHIVYQLDLKKFDFFELAKQYKVSSFTIQYIYVFYCNKGGFKCQ